MQSMAEAWRASATLANRPPIRRLRASCRDVRIHEVGVDLTPLGSGGHGTRTRNSIRSTSFPMRPLAIRLPSRMAQTETARLSGIPNRTR